MTTNCASQSAVSQVGVGAAYDRSSEYLRVELVSSVSCRWYCCIRLTKTIFSHSTHDVKKALPIVTSGVVLD